MSTNPHAEPVLRALRTAHALYGSAFLVGLALLLANSFLFTAFSVDGRSMEPTLMNGEPMLIGLAAYDFSSPRLGDVVIVAYRGDSRVRFVKRIEGVPGDTVTVAGLPVLLGPGQYYVLGDNRDASTDSRAFGPVDRSQIIGKVLLPTVPRAFFPAE